MLQSHKGSSETINSMFDSLLSHGFNPTRVRLKRNPVLTDEAEAKMLQSHKGSSETVRF